MSFFIRLENWQVLPGGVGTSGRRDDIRKGCKRVNKVQILCTKIVQIMYANGKMRPVETTPGIGEGG
jgi:hypothetical protein